MGSKDGETFKPTSANDTSLVVCSGSLTKAQNGLRNTGIRAGALSETVEAPVVEELSTAAKATGDNKTPSLSRLPYAGGLLARGSSNPPS